jgi:hypothetical protein
MRDVPNRNFIAPHFALWEHPRKGEYYDYKTDHFGYDGDYLGGLRQSQ